MTPLSPSALKSHKSTHAILAVDHRTMRVNVGRTMKKDDVAQEVYESLGVPLSAKRAY